MKRRQLPQWLIDATSGDTSDKSPKRVLSSQNCLHESHESHNSSNEYSDQRNSNSNKIQRNETISVVPLANLLALPKNGVSIPNVQMNSEMDADMQETRSLPLNVKTEKDDATSDIVNLQDAIVIKEEIKVEPSDPVDTLAQAMVVPKVEDVKTERLSCNFGIKCFRRNAVHRTEMAHPGDADYRRPNFPNAPAGTPMCPWGAACYRRNPQHFINLSHPPASLYTPAASSTTTVPQANHMPYRTRNNNRNNQRVDSRLGDSNDLDSNDSDFEDPFIDNGSSDEYIPNEDEDDDIEDS